MVLNGGMKSPLERSIDICGGQTALAKSIGVKQCNVWSWVNRFGNKVPAEFSISVSRSTNWQVTPHQLRPDIYPNPQDGLPDDMRAAA